ncbi:MAG TPA: phenylalanine--tRNA ligase subunit beta [Acidimicrobiales bacterium]|nr:phenylalanine--tRNA ligase subunit beta [Acidimicrobiales bacterium]
MTGAPGATEASVAELAHTLAFLGLVVDGIERVAAPWPGIVVARVLATRAHPAADRIHLVDVDAGDGEALQVCCGAFNMRAGDLVPLATVGTTMPSGIEIGRRKMRGEWSNGMLCSAAELGLGPDGPVPAIMLLGPELARGRPLAPGEELAPALGIGPEVVFDLDISPNRSDCFSIAGVARDLAAAMRLPFSVPEPRHSVDEAVEAANVSVRPAAQALCARFTGTVIEGVQAAAVPALVAYRLALSGMRPISPIVDVSNYVMLELGQPNHPYDLDRLGGRGLSVRRADEGETLVTLDGSTRVLTRDDLVIADGTGAAVGLAGIMGGASAEISAATASVLLEMANFDPLAVAMTGKRLGLSSEARTRFERGVDIELPDRAIDRFVELLGPGVRRGPTTDERVAQPPLPSVRLRAARVNLVLGTHLSREDCAKLLAPLGFEASPGAASDELDVSLPTWRPDCRREVDLVEEIARIYGYDNIARSLPQRPMAATGLTGLQQRRRVLVQALAGAGVDEAWTVTFLSEADLARCRLDPAEALELENPLDQSQRLLRTSLLPGLLRALRFNAERQAGAVSLFELGSVFSRPAAGMDEDLVAGVHEWQQLGVVATGTGAGAAYAVRIWELAARALRLPGAAVAAWDGGPAAGQAPGALAAWECLHPGRRAAVTLAGTRAGIVGELAPDVARRHELAGPVAVVVVDLAPMLAAPGQPWSARPVSRYPASDFDMAFNVADGVAAADLQGALRAAAGELLEELALFDVWRDPSLGEGRRSLAFRARLRAADRTLTDAEVASVRDAAAAAVAKAYGAVLRAG